eukprot:Nitzschia sp. Nitz4//scaffold386_size12300//82//825//NITZ4_008991-RA/size12300-processed-gene-0.23-mRNA-1//1//CDS//3329549957//1567//frame0
MSTPTTASVSASAIPPSKPPSKAVSMDTSVFPIRVDVSSQDKSTRVIETLLLDPTCWPIPLTAPLHEAVERNVQHLAHSILSDAEVMGMGRTVRHFTGRVDVWTAELQRLAEDQLRPQLWAVLEAHTTRRSSLPVSTSTKTSSLIPISIRLMFHGITIHEDIQWDPSVPLSPFAFAETLAHDLNLSQEAIVPIWTTMLEQLHGLTVDTSVDESVSQRSAAQLRGAWKMDPKEVVMATSQLVAQQRPR